MLPSWLVPPERRFGPSPFRYHAGHRPHLVDPVELVGLHYSASPWTGDLQKDLARIRTWLEGQGRESSTHFAIMRDGLVVQGVPLTDRAWHITDAYPHEGRPINPRSIAIDFMNVGFLRRRRGQWVDDYGNVYRGPTPVVARRLGWEPVTPAQMAAAVDLVAQLGALFPGVRLIRHSDVQPTRSDPGPTVDMAALQAALGGA